MKRTFVVLAFASLSVAFVACQDDSKLYESNNTERISEVSFKEKVVVRYAVDAKITDIYGKPHTFKGHFDVVYLDGEPISVRFTGYYDGKYYDNAGIIFYTKEDKNYGSFDSETGIYDVFENMQAWISELEIVEK